MNDIKISVIIPSYNAEKYIARCIDSVLNTGYDNLEIICINDGSKDGTLAVLRDYEKKYDSIKVIDIPNGGVSRARNLGIEKISGDFVTFIDADDWIHPQFFSILLDAQQKYDSDISIGNYTKIKEYYIDKEFTINESDIKFFEGDSFLEYGIYEGSSCMRLYRASLIKNIRFYTDIKYGEDTLFNLSLYANNIDIKATVTNCIVYYYYMTPGSSTSKLELDKYIHTFKKYRDIVEEENDPRKAKIYLSKSIPDCLSCSLRVKYSDNKKTANKELNKVLFDSLKLAKKYKCFPFSKYMYFQVFAKFPFVYRWFRIMNDPTIREWEKLENKKYKQNKNKKA